MFYGQAKKLTVESFERLTGENLEPFKVMVKALRRAEGTNRKSGRRKKLSFENQLLMTLMYLRDCTYFHIGHASGINASTAYRIVRHVKDTLSEEEAFKLPNKRLLQEGSFDLSFVIETSIERPKKQGQDDSGKKKWHTLKSQVVLGWQGERNLYPH